jgi:hypothetical protein
LNRTDEAATLLDEALPMAQQFTGEHSPITIAAMQSAAQVRLMQHNPAAAAPLIDRVTELCRANLGEKHPLYAASVLLRADLFAEQGKTAEAAELIDQARQILVAAGNAGKTFLPDVDKAALRLQSTASKKQ